MTNMSDSNSSNTQQEFESLVQAIRPELHQYCARMIGSVIDAEDVVQEALAKAYASLPETSVANLRGWIFRIAHNKAIDYLRRAYRQQLDYLDEDALLVEAAITLEEQESVADALSLFLKVPPKQRSCVILKDVLGYSLADISELLDLSLPDIKSSLHRGRTRLRELAGSANSSEPPMLDEPERELLARYIERFNARDFDALRAMLADEVRLDLVNRATRRGIVEVGDYFHRYAQVYDWRLALGAVENRPAILVYSTAGEATQPLYFVLLTWDNVEAGEQARIAFIRDYRYAPYVMRGANVVSEELSEL